MELKTLKYGVRDKIATITLNRPHRMNAWTGRMHTEYRYVLDQADRAADVRAIVVTGEGKGFCVGADTKALEGHIEKVVMTQARRMFWRNLVKVSAQILTRLLRIILD